LGNSSQGGGAHRAPGLEVVEREAVRGARGAALGLGVEGLLSLVTGDVSVTVEGRVFEHRFASRARSTGDGRQM